MKFTVDTASLQRAIKVLGIVARTNTTDSTGRILIEAADDGGIVFMCNNGITAASFTIDNADVETKGAVSIEYGKIKSFVFSYKSWDGESGVDRFLFVADERIMKIVVCNKYNNGKSVKGELKLATANPSLITKIPTFGQTSFMLNSTIFRAATNKILYAINPQVDYSQPSLQGMHIRFEEDSIFFAGSNGIVLSEYQVKNVSEYTEDKLTLQYDFIMGLRRLLTDDIQLSWNVKGNSVIVKFGEVVYFGRKIVGHDFPQYKSALDKYTDHINLSKEFLMDALHPFADVLDIEDNYRLTIEIKDKTLKIFNSQAIIESDLDIAGGLDFSIDLNGKLLIQTVDAIKDDHILFKFSDSKGFAIFDSSTFNDQKALISSIKKR